ncbi:MAG: ABC transporter permease [Actinomycetota bacterium]|nr:ABC transporter permease [Actinomycetota bacterium]
MARYVAARFAWLLAVLLAVSAVTFALGVLAPGDPAVIVFQRTRPAQSPTPQELAALRKEMGLDGALPVQYLRWLGRAVQGDLGESWSTGQRVTAAVRERLPRTALLAGAALVVSVGIAIPLGVLAAYRRNTVVDHFCRVGALVGASLPSFLVAYVLILYLAVRINVFPVFGFGSAASLALPALTLALGSAGTLTRFTRAAVLDVLAAPYVQTGKAKGVPTMRLLFDHALRNAALPVVTVIGLSLAGLLGGAFVVEWIFNWPGLGTLAVEAINAKDYPVIQGFVLVTAAACVVVNFLTDLVYASLDPRVRLTRDTT